MAHTKMQVDHNGTRVAAQHNLLYSELRLSPALPLYHARISSSASDWLPPAAKAKQKEGKWDADSWRWPVMTEFEGVLKVTSITTKLPQYEQLYSGAFGPLIKSTALTLDRVRCTERSRCLSRPRLAVRAYPSTSQRNLVGLDLALRQA